MEVLTLNRDQTAVFHQRGPQTFFMEVVHHRGRIVVFGTFNDRLVVVGFRPSS